MTRDRCFACAGLLLLGVHCSGYPDGNPFLHFIPADLAGGPDGSNGPDLRSPPDVSGPKVLVDDDFNNISKWQFQCDSEWGGKYIISEMTPSGFTCSNLMPPKLPNKCAQFGVDFPGGTGSRCGLYYKVVLNLSKFKDSIISVVFDTDYNTTLTKNSMDPPMYLENIWVQLSGNGLQGPWNKTITLQDRQSQNKAWETKTLNFRLSDHTPNELANVRLSFMVEAYKDEYPSYWLIDNVKVVANP